MLVCLLMGPHGRVHIAGAIKGTGALSNHAGYLSNRTRTSIRAHTHTWTDTHKYTCALTHMDAKAHGACVSQGTANPAQHALLTCPGRSLASRMSSFTGAMCFLPCCPSGSGTKWPWPCASVSNRRRHRASHCRASMQSGLGPGSGCRSSISNATGRPACQGARECHECHGRHKCHESHKCTQMPQIPQMQRMPQIPRGGLHASVPQGRTRRWAEGGVMDTCPSLQLQCQTSELRAWPLRARPIPNLGL